jgi:hypothetical protein
MRLIRIGATHKRRAFPLALIAIATVSAAAACGPSGNKPAAQDTQTQPAARLQKFTSQRYSFRVTLAKDWSEVDASVAWNGNKLQGLESPSFANFTDTAKGRTLVAAAAPVAKGMGLAEWRAAMVRAAPSVCSQSSSVEQTTLGGEPALAWTATCSDGYHVSKVATLHGNRGYMMFLASPTANHIAENQRTFDAIRRSFRFTH